MGRLTIEVGTAAGKATRRAPAEVLALRRQQVKNFFTLLMLANGTPMFCAGDEFLNTQHGNNNPYNQDNETTWLDWSLLEKNRDMFRFFQYMIAFRKARPWIARSRYWREDVHWYGANGPVDFASRTLAYCLHGGSDLYVMINAFWEPVAFPHSGRQRASLDTYSGHQPTRHRRGAGRVHSLSSRSAFRSRAGSQKLNSRKGAALTARNR